MSTIPTLPSLQAPRQEQTQVFKTSSRNPLTRLSQEEKETARTDTNIRTARSFASAQSRTYGFGSSSMPPQTPALQLPASVANTSEPLMSRNRTQLQAPKPRYPTSSQIRNGEIEISLPRPSITTGKVVNAWGSSSTAISTASTASRQNYDSRLVVESFDDTDF